MSKGKAESDKKRKHTHNTITLERKCKEVIVLERLELLASNATKPVDKTHNNATENAEVKPKPPMALPDSPL